MAKRTIANVPEDQVSEVIKGFVESGFSDINLFKNADGTWTITGTDSTGPR